MSQGPNEAHPRTIGWVGTTALAMGGSNQSLFVLGALLAAQGTSAIPLLLVGLVLSWMALPGWIELIMMWPNRVGGIAATCAEAFRPYSPVLANLTGVCYWWGWIPTCGLTALLAATALHAMYVPFIGVHVLATAIVAGFLLINLRGIRIVTKVAVWIASVAAVLAFASAVIPVWAGSVDWQRAGAWHIRGEFPGWFGNLSSAMAGLYLIGFAAPAFEAAACHVGETRDAVRNVPRAMFASAGIACLYFIALPVIWLGVIGPKPLIDDPALVTALGPVFSPLLHGGAQAAVVWFLVANMLHGSLQPLAGASRTLSQLADDGLLPRSLSRRNRRDTPWVATTLTAVIAVVFLWFDDPPPVIAAANFAYLIGICLPSIAVWLLRRNSPDMERPWRAWPGMISLGVIAAVAWGVSTLLGFQQYGLNYVIFGLALAYAGSAAYVWRRRSDRKQENGERIPFSLHMKLTGAMLAVMVLDGAGYLLAVANVRDGEAMLITVLQDIFVAVALLTISVGLVLPGMISHAVTRVSEEAKRLTDGALESLSRGLAALGSGDISQARAEAVVQHVEVSSRDEVAAMAATFNLMQDKVAAAASSLDGARERLRESHERLRDLADRDPLTGLCNRRRFEEELTRVVAEHSRRRAGSALLMIDIDNFKLVNDSRGHMIGDALLKQVAQVLRTRLRQSDILARLGGDEFAVLLPATDRDTALKVAADLVETIRRETSVIEDDGHRVRVTASIGVTMTEVSSTPGQLLVDADVALYDAKESGRNRVAMALRDGGRADQLRSRQDWLDALRDAIENDRFELHAQPMVDVNSGLVAKHELLLRLRSADGEVLPPGAFLPLAEQVGLIQEIDRWVIRRGHQQLRSDHARGVSHRYSINLSGASITDAEVIALIEEESRALPETAPRLMIEVTETAAIANIDDASGFAQRLAALGCTFALDDFGAGFGSFYYLKRLPFDFIKIDGEFIRELGSSPVDRHVVSAIVDIAKGLSMQTIAEFVEDEATLVLLGTLGVDFAQGYHVGRPAPLLHDPLPVRLPAPRPPRVAWSPVD